MRHKIPFIEFYMTHVLGHDAPPLGLPCHTCRPLSSPSIKHLNHHQPLVVNEKFTCSTINKKFPCFVVNKELSCSIIMRNYLFYYEHEQKTLPTRRKLQRNVFQIFSKNRRMGVLKTLLVFASIALQRK